MLSPKIQRGIRVNESQLLMLADKARLDNSLQGHLYKRTANNTRWQLRWFVLYQNLLFYYDNEASERPAGIILLEGCYCQKQISTDKGKQISDKQLIFSVSYRADNQRHYELRASTESDCKTWIQAIEAASFNKLLQEKEELEQKHLHLLQIVESEKTEKWQFYVQCEEIQLENKELKAELRAVKKERDLLSKHNTAMMGAKPGLNRVISSESADSNTDTDNQDNLDLWKIKKVQSFFRGWLCRRRWKQIVEQYIKSPHAESMRKRNSLVFRMVEAEEEYVEQMETLVACFLRPFKMAASSKKPPCTHEDVNSIFLNSETVLFLHQIFLKGLTSRMESWPTLVLGDLFDMLLPMLNIYQEYVRNHHFSLQVLTECKQSPQFAALLDRLENKPACQGRSLEFFLTYPMHQVPRYIITLHELLAHTPHDHVERKSLQNAQQQLEDLSRQMHDEVSETENLRKNLAVERMIVEGCDILLDVNQVFVRQGSLIQIPTDKEKSYLSRIAHFKSEKEAICQCFLFSNHMILTRRASNGRLHLLPDVGRIPLTDAILIEDPSEHELNKEDNGATHSSPSHAAGGSEDISKSPLHNHDFKLILDSKTGNNSFTLHLVAPSMQEKQAWISDISQCIDNVHFNDLLYNSLSDTSSVTMPQSMKNDPKLFKNDKDIRFSRTLNSCRVPQITYATPQKLLERLTDLRFLSIDFLNTFLLTYRVFTDGVAVLEALKKVFYTADPPDSDTNVAGSIMSLEGYAGADENMSCLQLRDPSERRRSSCISPRRVSGASSVSGLSGYGSESDKDRSASYDSQGYSKIPRKQSFCRFDEIKESCQQSSFTSPTQSPRRKVSIRVEQADQQTHLTPPTITTSASNETLIDGVPRSSSSSPSNVSSVTLVGSNGSTSNLSSVTLVPSAESPVDSKPGDPQTSISSSSLYTAASSSSTHQDPVSTQPVIKECFPKKSENCLSPKVTKTKKGTHNVDPSVNSVRKQSVNLHLTSVGQTGSNFHLGDGQGVDYRRRASESVVSGHPNYLSGAGAKQSIVVEDTSSDAEDNRCFENWQASTSSNSRSGSIMSTTFTGHHGRRSVPSEYDGNPSQRPSIQHDSPQHSTKSGVVITSFRQSQRRSSISTAASAFAIATSGASNPRDVSPMSKAEQNRIGSCRNKRKESVLSTAATMRVLNVLRHWISKHPQDFEGDGSLKELSLQFLEDILSGPNLLPAEHKAATHLQRLLTKEDNETKTVDLNALLTVPPNSSRETIESLSALEIAEQMTYLDHQIFVAIRCEEFLGQAWMKEDRATKAPHITLMTKRFNEVSQLVVSEIIRRPSVTTRVAAIEKWAAVADISRCLHNFNGVLQICAAFNNSTVFRLRKTWEKVSKSSKQTIDKLQSIVSSDGRFRNLRDALHRSDPPCIPYLGIYLTDLSFLEEGTPNFTEDGLLNFAKMRMIAHVIREIRHFQQVPYKIELIPKAARYLLDPALLLDDDELYRISLEIEPRTSRLSSAALTGLPLTQPLQTLRP
ncbi:ras-specific guanine nucleotide-releasing factor 1 isoform X2 [Bemisia tabaci]|uniref:ras-specific guanine nucleotide-releasing factor 1 isoform X2 n=1 Tax=Bemisia tabaci TaxID=7038 RepID=UPI0008F9C55F|nr:PREDICTED: ras-specific guanine nucleotide-releasing factor 2-like isoform X2 [Bemisia tabaci]